MTPLHMSVAMHSGHLGKWHHSINTYLFVFKICFMLDYDTNLNSLPGGDAMMQYLIVLPHCRKCEFFIQDCYDNSN